VRLSEKYIRSLIIQELKRPHPIEAYSDRELMLEKAKGKGPFAALSNLFSPLSKVYDDAWKGASKNIGKFWDSGIRAFERSIEDQQRKDIKNLKDLNLDNKEDQGDYFSAISGGAAGAFEEAARLLDEAEANVKDWTPNSDDEETVEAWKNSEDGKGSDSLFEAHGLLMGLGEKTGADIPKIKSIVDEGMNVDAPHEAVAWIQTFCKNYKELQEGAEKADADEDFDKVIEAIEKTEAAARKVAASIDRSVNEEIVSMKKLINSYLVKEGLIKKNLGFRPLKENKKAEALMDDLLDDLLIEINYTLIENAKREK